jgi:hypothetical protein
MSHFYLRTITLALSGLIALLLCACGNLVSNPTPNTGALPLKLNRPAATGNIASVDRAKKAHANVKTTMFIANDLTGENLGGDATTEYAHPYLNIVPSSISLSAHARPFAGPGYGKSHFAAGRIGS